MADNSLQNGTDTIATDDVTTLNGGASSGIKVQRVKVGSGSDNTFNDATTASGLPVLQNDVSVTGALAAAAAVVTLALNGQSGATAQITGTWAGTIQFEVSNDGTNWTPVNAVAASTSSPQPTTTVNGFYRLTPSGALQLRANMTVFGSGSASVIMRASAGTGGVFVTQILPAKITDGTNTVTIKPASTAAVAADSPLVVTMHPSTAVTPVSAATLPLPTGASTETTLAGVRTDLGTDGTTPPTVLGAGTGVRGWLRSIYEKLTGTLAVTGTFFQATQPVSLATNTPTIAAGTASIGTVQPPAITKGTQGTVGVTTQDLKDAGRNAVHYYTVIPVLSTAIDALQTLTGTKGGATVVATATPAVVTAGKNFRVTRMAATYIATAVSGYGIVRLRAQAAGIVTITSPVYATLAVGSGAPTTANATDTEEATLDEAIEFAAGFGVGISVQGFAAVTATAVGYLLVSLTGYEY